MRNIRIIKIDPLWYNIPIDPDNPGGGDDPTGGGTITPPLPGLGSFLRRRYTSNTVIADEMSVVDLIHDVLLVGCRGYLTMGSNGKIRLHNKKPVDFALGTAAMSGTSISVDDASPWVDSLAYYAIIDPHTVNSEVRTVISAVYPTSQNSTTLTSSHPTEIVVTAFSGAAGGSTPATATIDTGAFVVDTEYTITLDGIKIVFIPRSSDTGESIAGFIAGAVRGDPRLSRRFTATYASDVVTLTAKFGTLTLNSALTETHTAPVANPTVAPTLASNAAGSLPAGDYRVAYTFRNGRGQTLLSPFKEQTIAADESIDVASVSPPAGCTVVWYVSVEAGSSQIRYHSENDGSAFNIDWPLPKKSASYPPAFNRTGAEVMRVVMVFSDREETRSAIGASNVIKGTFKWLLGNRRSRKNVIELQYREASQDFRLVKLIERDDANIAKIKEQKKEKVNGQAIDNYFQAKRISTGLLAEALDADFFYEWSATRRALLLEEGDVVAITDNGSGVINLPVMIEDIDIEADRAGLPLANFTARKYYSTLYDDSVNELSIPVISEI